MELTVLKAYLEEKVEMYNHLDFIASDPIQIPHLFHKKEDIEIAAFLTSTIAWGNRKAILKSARYLMKLMEDTPFDFITGANNKEIEQASAFYYRTFQKEDCTAYLKALQQIYTLNGGLSAIFTGNNVNTWEHIQRARGTFFSHITLERTNKHFANPMKGASCKRLHMFLRWMVRKDEVGVDFGIWNHILPSQLSLPLDVHTGNISRKLGLLNRKANDRKAVEEIDLILRQMDPNDPAKYDFALFGLGVNNESSIRN